MSGSSPRVWGQETAGISSACSLGIIPTRVGTRTAYSLMSRAWEDHPHACGDKRDWLWLAYRLVGSSPRVWGQGWSVVRPSNDTGIIPTRVGTSSLDNNQLNPFKDHPHACGDKSCEACATSELKGSSPRVWGQVIEQGNAGDIDRIIPTRVGTSHVL